MFSKKYDVIYAASIDLNIDEKGNYQRGELCLEIREILSTGQRQIHLLVDDKHEKVRLRIPAQQYVEFFGKLDDIKIKIAFKNELRSEISRTEK